MRPPSSANSLTLDIEGKRCFVARSTICFGSGKASRLQTRGWHRRPPWPPWRARLRVRVPKVMCHIGGVETRTLMSQLLDLLRPGDILTHCYSGFPNLAGDFTNIVQDGRLLPAALAAKQRGVVFNIGHGGGSFDSR